MRHSELHRRGDTLLDRLADLEHCPSCSSRLPCWRPEHSSQSVRELLREAAAVVRAALGRGGGKGGAAS